jgi:hypothetical protein
MEDFLANLVRSNREQRCARQAPLTGSSARKDPVRGSPNWVGEKAFSPVSQLTIVSLEQAHTAQARPPLAERPIEALLTPRRA